MGFCVRRPVRQLVCSAGGLLGDFRMPFHIYFLFMCVRVYLPRTTCTGAFVEAREGGGSPEAGIAGACELPDVGAWELDSGPPQEQQALLTTEPFARPTLFLLRCY